jgi:hypothetical protein
MDIVTKLPFLAFKIVFLIIMPLNKKLIEAMLKPAKKGT